MKILNDESSDNEEYERAALGISKRQFEAQLNQGFEKNMPRYKKKNENMMAMEWSNKVAASDRAEAKLYPILNIDTSNQATKYEKGRRRNSIF